MSLFLILKTLNDLRQQFNGDKIDTFFKVFRCTAFITFYQLHLFANILTLYKCNACLQCSIVDNSNVLPHQCHCHRGEGKR